MHTWYYTNILANGTQFIYATHVNMYNNFLHPIDTYYFFASFRLTARASSWAVAVFSSAAIVMFPLV